MFLSGTGFIQRFSLNNTGDYLLAIWNFAQTQSPKQPPLPTLANHDASLIMQSHAVNLLIGKCMEFMSQSVPQKNLVVEFHSPHSSLLVVTKCLNWKGTWS